MSGAYGVVRVHWTVLFPGVVQVAVAAFPIMGKDAVRVLFATVTAVEVGEGVPVLFSCDPARTPTDVALTTASHWTKYQEYSIAPKMSVRRTGRMRANSIALLPRLSCMQRSQEP